LLLSAGFGLAHFFARADAPSDEGAAELRQLECIGAVISDLTFPGQRVRLDTAGDDYLRQRVSELVYPRVEVVEDLTAGVLTVQSHEVPPAGAQCGNVVITPPG
jgi:hypothetical protein